MFLIKDILIDKIIESPISSLIEINGINIHYLDWQGEGEPIIFLAGLGNTSYIFLDLMAHFCDKFRVLAITRRGHGQSDAPNEGYDSRTLSKDIVGILDKLGIPQATFVGFSFAGTELSALALYHSQRISRLILLDAVSTPSHEEQLATTMPAPYPEPSTDQLSSVDAYRLWLQTQMYAGYWTNALESNLHEIIIEHSDGRVSLKMQDHIAGQLMDNEIEFDALASDRLPILSIHAITDQFPGFEAIVDPALRVEVDQWVKDVAVPVQRSIAESFRQMAPHAKVIEIEGANHFCFIDREEEVAGLMLAFLDEWSKY